MKFLWVLMLCGVLSSCTVQRTVRVKNVGSENVYFVEGMVKKQISPGQTVNYPVATCRTFTLGLATTKSVSIAGGFAGMEHAQTFPDEFSGTTDRWADKSWFFQLRDRHAGTLTIYDKGAFLEFEGKVVELDEDGK